MKDFIVLFVVINPTDMKIEYMSREMAGPIYPNNELADILELVLAANAIEEDKTIFYVDVYGVYIDERLEYWEVFND